MICCVFTKLLHNETLINNKINNISINCVINVNTFNNKLIIQRNKKSLAALLIGS